MRNILSKIIIARNVIVFLLLFYITTQSKAITQSTEKLHYKIVQNIHYNPFQYLNDFVYWGISYVMDFVHFREQKLEIRRLNLQMTSLVSDYSQIKIEKESLAQIVSSLMEVDKTYPVKKVVKLYYSIANDNVREIYFKSSEDIPLNSFVFNESCLIGRVLHRDGDRYHILSYEDPRFRLPVYTENSKVFGIIHGGSPILKFVPFSNFFEGNVVDSEKLLTASLDERFTENIPVGNIMREKDKILVKTSCKHYYSYGLII